MKCPTESETTLLPNGRLWLRNALPESLLEQFDAATGGASRPGARVAGAGCLQGALQELSAVVGDVVPGMFAVRVVLFNKTETNNWSVPWHQDRVIAVQARHDVDGFSNWSQKAGVWHCEPPRNILDNMLFVRVHLDATDGNNGAMQIAPGSHRAGKIAMADAARVASRYQSETCVAGRGDVLLLDMLTLHRSTPSETPDQRRVFRIDFARTALPSPLGWAMTGSAAPPPA